MTKNRMEAFSDGVLAVIITIMVLEMRAPRSADVHALSPLIPVFLSYVMSFVFLGIYWSNHHHLLQAVRSITGPILWANLHLLFWLSLTPFVTNWMGEPTSPPGLPRSTASCCSAPRWLTTSWPARSSSTTAPTRRWRSP